MIKSMTGYGRAKREENGREYVVEIKSVNHKYSDINMRLPKNLSYLEEKIKKVISATITRGKVDVFIEFNNFSEEGKDIKINQELANRYIRELSNLAKENDLPKNIEITDIFKFPEVLVIKNTEEMEELIWKELEGVLKEALHSFMTMRIEEGIKLKEDMIQRMNKVEKQVQEITNYSSDLIKEYITKLENRIKEILKVEIVDQTRLAQEIVIYADKCSVEEEVTRLKSHISQFRNLLEEKQAIGKKLDFIIQEMNRETNTIGSKSGCIEITNLVIDIKTELEDIREQVQNIE